MDLVKKCFLLVLSVVQCPHLLGTAQIQTSFSCNGAFDIYFVLDKSGSLIDGGYNHFQEETVSFVRNLVSHFTSPLSRLSFITFSDMANVVLPLTNDRIDIETKLQELSRVIPDGVTNLNFGLEKVVDQIQQDGTRRASVVIVLTDGNLENLIAQDSYFQANLLRSYGATIVTVGVGSTDPNQLLRISGGIEEFTFQTANFDGLQKIVLEVIEGSCVEIISADPTNVCFNSSFVVNIEGRGFDKALHESQIKCSFFFSREKNYLVTPTSISSTLLTCPSPENAKFSSDNVIVVQVSLNNGTSFISSNVTIDSAACTVSPALIAGIVVPLLLLLLLLLWWFANAICCAAAAKKKPEADTKPSKPTTPIKPPMVTKKWAVVDASYYGARGAGGISPMKVTWGEKGCTDGGIHLEKTKEAVEVGYIEKQVPDLNHQNQDNNAQASSCCKGKCSCLWKSFVPCLVMFQHISRRRPSKDNLKNCVLIKPSTEQNRNQPKKATNISAVSGNDYLNTRH